MRQILLQNVTAIFLQNMTEVYYKTRQVFITKCDVYYKLRQYRYKAVEFISFSSILTNNQLDFLLKVLPGDFVTHTVVCNLKQPISSSIFSFKKFVSNANVDQFLTDPSSILCNCVNSSFKDSYHDHIVTGDLEPRKESITNQGKQIFTKQEWY